MFSHKLGDNVGKKTYLHWFVLSFVGGHLNVGGYLGCHKFVSHVTGFATLTGAAVQKLDWSEAFSTLMIPLFFLGGVMVSGYLTEKQYAHKIHGQKYAPVMGIVAALLLFVVIAGSQDFFGVFGSANEIKHGFIFLACLCAACGLQNGATTSASGATIRTTHLTGITTDLGLGIIYAGISLSEPERRQERKRNWLRAGTIFSFIMGSVVGAFIYSKYQFYGFLMPAIIAIYFSYIARSSNRLTPS